MVDPSSTITNHTVVTLAETAVEGTQGCEFSAGAGLWGPPSLTGRAGTTRTCPVEHPERKVVTVPPAKRRTARTSTAAGEDDDFQQVIVRVPAEMHRAVKERAEAEERTMSQVMRRALREYLQVPVG
jgi:hypothetical protein